MNIPRANLRPMPRDFPEYAAKLGVSGLRERYKCGNIAIRRWRQECGVPPLSNPPTPPPDDFAEIAPLHTVSELRRIYKRGGAIISRWQKETGVRAKNGRSRYRKHDKSEEIQVCLNCSELDCTGDCSRVSGRNF